MVISGLMSSFFTLIELTNSALSKRTLEKSKRGISLIRRFGKQIKIKGFFTIKCISDLQHTNKNEQRLSAEREDYDWFGEFVKNTFYLI